MEVQRVERPPQIVNIDTLVGCRDGLTRRIKKTKKKLEKDRLREIREEIDYLIEVL